MQENQKGEKLIQNLAVLYWERVVGTQASLSTEADTVRDGILFVNTRSSVWSHELTLYKKRILADLNTLLGEECILDIKFRVRKLRQDTPPLETVEPTQEDLKRVVLDPAERAELRARLEGLIEIPEDKIREKIALRMVGDARLRHWRIAHGWKICVRCQGLHTEPERLCPICRLYG
jgi:predicted nucleic acid-binding Zn ribbon protein